MTPDEFWFGDPELYYNYARVYETRQKDKQQELWAIGARFCQALQSTPIFPVGVVDANALRSMPPYPECPYTEKKAEEMTEEEIAFERQKARIHFTNWVNSFKRGGNNGGQ